MQTTPRLSLLILAGLLLLTTGCTDETVTPPFAQVNASYTAQFAFTTTSQQVVQSPDGKNIIKVVVAGTGTFSFAGAVTFTDAFDFILATGAAAHKVVFTTTAGDKIYTTMTTQVGPGSITGMTTFTGGTGRFARLNGSGPNVGPLVGAMGEGSWTEAGGTVTF